MRQENFRNKAKINQMTTALLGIFFYIILVLILKTIQNWINIDSVGMKIFDIFKLAAAVVYLILFTWGNFKSATQETGKRFGKYLILTMIPLAVVTVISIIISYTGAGSTFGSKWNAVTFVIGPTIFCYIPYGILFRFVSNMPLALFYLIGFGLIVLCQYLGYLLGSGSRKFARERELVRAEQERRMMQRQDAMARQMSQERRNVARKATVARRRTIVDENDPFKDMESMAVVETEAFSRITDEMIEEAIRQNKIKPPQNKTVQTAANQQMAAKQQAVAKMAEQAKVTSEAGKMTSLPAAKSAVTAESTTVRQQAQQSVNAAPSAAAEAKTPQDFAKEMAYLRQRLEKRGQGKQ